MNYRLLIDPAAARQLERLDAQILNDLTPKISALTKDPRPAGCKLLLDSKARGWRIRVGKYRVLYIIDDTKKEVTVYDIGLRDRVYKKR